MTEYHSSYFAHELSRRHSLNDSEKLASALADAQVDLNPHQLDAALFAFRSPLSKGSILADEVGLGKTIEAGLVIAQKWSERKRRILIITPANLRKQWSQEMVEKFYLPATPLQNSLMELYGLVSVIDEYAFGDDKSFRTQYARLTSETSFDELKARLTPICHRTLRRQVLEYIRTLILRKLLASSTYAIAGALESLANRLRKQLKDARAENGLYDINEMDEIKQDYDEFDSEAEEWDEEAEPEVLSPADIQVIEAEIKELELFRDLAVSITENAKGHALISALTHGFRKAKELGAAEKAIVFTESRKTQAYLINLLSQQGYQDKIVLFNGTNTDPLSKVIYTEWVDKYKNTDHVTGSKSADLRAALVDYFRDHAQIMIATEAGAEGINLQFCSMVVNYDLPWNPQRIEQRIGRCHRYGQKHDVVVINFINRKNAADQRVYELLDQKFKLFSGVFGASDEVLGVIESGV